MVVGFRDSIGMFLFSGWDGGRKSNFGYYFATLVFVATLCFFVEAVPYIRGKFLTPKSKVKGDQYAEIQNRSNTQDVNERHFKPLHQSPNEGGADGVSFSLHFADTILMLAAKVCMYLLMLSVMSYNFGVIMTASVAFPMANFIFSVIQDREYISKRL